MSKKIKCYYYLFIFNVYEVGFAIKQEYRGKLTLHPIITPMQLRKQIDVIIESDLVLNSENNVLHSFTLTHISYSVSVENFMDEINKLENKLQFNE